jgi:hypothetical protein
MRNIGPYYVKISMVCMCVCVCVCVCVRERERERERECQLSVSMTKYLRKTTYRRKDLFWLMVSEV